MELLIREAKQKEVSPLSDGPAKGKDDSPADSSIKEEEEKGELFSAEEWEGSGRADVSCDGGISPPPPEKEVGKAEPSESQEKKETRNYFLKESIN